MAEAHFRFYAELNDLLPAARRFVRFPWRFEGSPTIAEALASLGIPAERVDLALVNGESVPLTYRLSDGDRVSLYPVFERMDLSRLTKVRERPLRRSRFLVDPALPRLCVYLRALGFDSVVAAGRAFEDLAPARDGGRILATRDPGLVAASGATHAVVVRARSAFRQAVEIVDSLHLLDSLLPLDRCPHCNQQIAPGEDACPGCDRRLRKGPHARLARHVERALGR